MEIDRRHFLIGTALMLSSTSRAFAGVLESEAEAGDVEAGDLIAACRRPDGSYSVVVLTLDGMIVREIPLEGRGHDIAFERSSGTAVVFARRPGSFALAFDVHGRRNPTLITTPTNRHFYGHGAFSADGRLLYATEHDSDTRHGLLGVYNVTGSFARIGEMPTYGIGPHEVIMLPDAKTLAVANGGIETDAKTGRKKLNLGTMDPSLAFIDSTTGALLARHRHNGALHKLSIRHIAADGRGVVWFGGQWQGAVDESPELVGRASLDAPLRLLEPAYPLGAALAGYIGSVAVSGDGRVLAASAPRAGRTIYIDAERARVIGETHLADGCGLAGLSKSEFALSSGMGVLQTDMPDHTHLTTASFPGRAFDNHLLSIR